MRNSQKRQKKNTKTCIPASTHIIKLSSRELQYFFSSRGELEVSLSLTRVEYDALQYFGVITTFSIPICNAFVSKNLKAFI